MTWTDRLALFSTLDYVAVAALVLGWLWIGWRIENPASHRPSVSVLMADFRRLWMQQMITRQPRMVDAQILANMRQGSTFFASAAMIAIGGGLALIGNTEPLAEVAQDLTLDRLPTVVWEIKLLLILVFLANAFLKFVWAHRLFGYCAVLVAAVPNEPDDPLALPRASQAAEIAITAARSFNRGLRSTYMTLAAAAWLLGPVLLLVATIATVAVLWRREFASHSREILLRTPPDTQS